MKRINKKEWCIALKNVGIYDNCVLGRMPMFLKGERATKEKVFNMIPGMTEDGYARCFRPATEEEINGEFYWDGKQYTLKRETKRMKSIKEKAEEYSFIRQDIGPSGIQYRDFSINKKEGLRLAQTMCLNK